MRQGQQNRRGRGRSSNNNNNNNANNNSSNNNNRKPQNPLARNFESSGPDVKIRGTAAQIAEKYMTLARDASSSGDIVMAENYLQHAEHYNRIIMAAQAQAAAASMGHQGVENGHGGMNGASHRNANGEAGPSMRDQPQPHIHPQSAPQPQIQPVQRVEPQSDEQPALNELPDFIQQPVREPKPEAAAKGRDNKDKDAAGIDPETGRPRRRRRYAAANGTANPAAAPEEANGNKAIEVTGDDRSSDEALA
ncbi:MULTISPECIES: DUF4167 domain-containing protein [Rhodomicrobium]|uniref:DUF4167 domain-containing protein n=1 Tax=Rhodomicrobium TaxID=1068 RepID=UPI000B4BB71C|nr:MULTISPECIES: DUF4167 domain-containing protein [Rhodomicrobium]